MDIRRFAIFYISLISLGLLFQQAVCQIRSGRLVTTYGTLLRTAQRMAGREKTILQDRFNNGVDRLPSDFDSVEPGMLEAVRRPLDSLAEEVGGMSRVINWLEVIMRSQNLAMPIGSVLNSVDAQLLNIKCPVVSPKNCSVTEKYRRVNGECNNLRQPLWGAAFTPMARELPASYETGLEGGFIRTDLPRQRGRNRALLPSARLVSNMVHSSSTTNRHSKVTMAFVFFGQQTAHDVTDTAFERGANGAFLDCCQFDSQVRGCASIPIPSRDFFRGFQRTCLPFARAKEVTDLECKTGERQQLNMVSSFVDGSNIYGHTESISQTLRGEEGQLKITEPGQLPFQVHPHIKAGQSGINFLNAGDERVSEVIGLTGVTVVWHREHNRIATQLAKFSRFINIVNPQERNDAIFNEARKIVIAMKQHITYNEFLRLAIGETAMTEYGLKSLKTGFFTGYDPNVNPTMANEVIVSAQRFGHSLLRNLLSLYTQDYTPSNKRLQLKKVFWRPNFYLVFENGFQRGVTVDAGEVCDRHIADDVRDHLFETQNGNGEDLVARNIQRGRDHGVESYNKVREFFGLSQASSFTSGGSTGFQHLNEDVVSKLRLVYGHPDDVDLFTGGISETPVEDGVVGPLFSKMLGNQFKKLKIGDRFWYEKEDTGFTLVQLDEIRKVTMAKLMCNNIEGITSIQAEVFEVPTNNGINDRVACDSLPEVNLLMWQ